MNDREVSTTSFIEKKNNNKSRKVLFSNVTAENRNCHHENKWWHRGRCESEQFAIQCWLRKTAIYYKLVITCIGIATHREHLRCPALTAQPCRCTRSRIKKLFNNMVIHLFMSLLFNLFFQSIVCVVSFIID